MSNDTSTEAKCPFHHTATTGEATTDHNWWPNRLKVELLHQHSAKSDPMGGNFNYAEEFKSLDLAALKKDLARPTSRCGWIRFTRKSRVIF